MGGNPTLYGYVKDPNAIVDFYGLIVVYRAVNPIQESSVNTGTSIQPKDAEVLIDGEIPKEAYTVVKKHH